MQRGRRGRESRSGFLRPHNGRDRKKPPPSQLFNEKKNTSEAEEAAPASKAAGFAARGWRSLVLVLLLFFVFSLSGRAAPAGRRPRGRRLLQHRQAVPPEDSNKPKEGKAGGFLFLALSSAPALRFRLSGGGKALRTLAGGPLGAPIRDPAKDLRRSKPPSGDNPAYPRESEGAARLRAPALLSLLPASRRSACPTSRPQLLGPLSPMGGPYASAAKRRFKKAPSCWGKCSKSFLFFP